MRKIFIILLVGWLVSVTMSLVWNHFDGKQKNRQLALQTGQAFFRQIVHTRAWNARHGGVYVPVTDKIKPNPYLKVQDRDIVTINGLQLTLVNPALMTRLIGEIAGREDDVTYHITSLKPIRPANAPDDWESKALKQFETGPSEFSEFVENENSVSFRFMAPLYVEQSCLGCHGYQGYQVNDVRGGISLNLPFKPLRLNIPLIFSHLAVALVGVIGIAS